MKLSRRERLFLWSVVLVIMELHAFSQHVEANDREIPNFIHICRKSDPELSECISKSVMDLRPYLKDGISKLNVPPIEPLYIEEFAVSQAGGVEITSTDVRVYGCSDFIINWLKADLDDITIEFQLQLPKLYIESRYKADGRIFLIPIHSSGNMTLNLTNSKANILAHGEIVEMDGENYMQFSDLQIAIRIREGSIYLDNFLGNQSPIGDVVSGVINNNFQLFIHQLQPSIEKALSDVMFNISNTVLSSYTFEQLFPQ